MRLTGKVALVNGSTRGVGRAIAEMFAAEGARVMVSGRDAKAGQSVVEGIAAAGGTAAFTVLDVTEEASVAAVAQATVDAFGSLNVVVNNAAHTIVVEPTIKRLAELSTDEWDAVLRGSLTGGVFWTCKYAVPHLVASGGGSVINVSSGQSELGMGGFAAYGAAKAGVNSLTRILAVEEAQRGIRANTLLLGRVHADDDFDSPVNPRRLTRNARMRDAAYVATWLASEESAVVTGSVVYADGGYAINGGTRLT